MIKDKLQRLRENMKEKNIFAYVIPSADFHQSEYVGEYFKCRQFISGFTGSAGAVVVTLDEAGLWTDGRYFIQAEEQLKGSTIKLFKMGEEGVPTIEQYLNSVLKDGDTLAFDGRVMSAKEGYGYEKEYANKNINVVYEYDLIDAIWEDRPSMSEEKAFLLDVKYGNGAFMQKEEDAIALAKAMVDIGNRAGKQTVAVITDMDEPLGNAVGNALEIKEVIDALHGDGPEDLMEVVYALGTQMLLLAKRAEDEEIARNLITESIQERKALKKFAEFIENQGGNREEILHPDMLPKARYVIPVLAEEEGCIERILAQDIGIACMTLGGGRENKESTIDHGVGRLF